MEAVTKLCDYVGALTSDLRDGGVVREYLLQKASSNSSDC